MAASASNTVEVLKCFWSKISGLYIYILYIYMYIYISRIKGDLILTPVGWDVHTRIYFSPINFSPFCNISL